MPDLSKLARDPDERIRAIPPNLVTATIRQAPAALTDELTVVIPSFADHHFYEVRYWSPRVDADGDTALPEAGDAGLIAFADDGEPWLVAWQPR